MSETINNEAADDGRFSTLLSIEVTFDSMTLFAGDRVNAVVTFKNLAKPNVPGPVPSATADPINCAPTEIAPRNSIDSFSRLSMQLSSSMRDLYAHLTDEPPTQVTANSSTLGSITSGLTRWASFRTPSKSRLSPQSTPSPSITSNKETLLMGYAQLEGHFSFDDQLVDKRAFQRARTHSTALFGNEEHTINGSNGLSSSTLPSLRRHPNHHKPILSSIGSGITGPRGHSQDKIPVFVTPQSLLFVDLNLDPGESRCFTYSMDLPRDLPPSARNKAVQIYYNLVIGVQRAPPHTSAPSAPQPKVVFIPFRVLPYIDSKGQQPAHELEKPIILTEDRAKVTAVENLTLPRTKRRRHSEFVRSTLKDLADAYSHLNLDEKPGAGVDNDSQGDDVCDFNDYISRLVESSQSQNQSQNLTSIIGPTTDNNSQRLPSPKPSRRQSISNQQQLTNHQQVCENIERAIHAPRPPLRAKCQYEISRNQQPLASLSLCKPIYRLGDIITLTLDFITEGMPTTQSCPVPCYHLTASLETYETLDPLISTKSKPNQEGNSAEPKLVHTQFANNQIMALTRKVYAQESVTLLNTRQRVVLILPIPPSATPQFKTSTMTNGWSIGLAFLTEFTPNNFNTNDKKEQQQQRQNIMALSPSISTKDGITYLAPQTLDTESFSCRIPLQVLPTNYDMGSLVGHSVTYGYVLW
ncbi:Rgp1-domain-containing protein [Nadsonia fulvescens var. elongata DSM 6958]|uniref:Rgp1-domain-containing protein n=1 Tax=Nadsonia fulvescens var. elongata DSM 6958 TaxID=857566 RepID=A0A1E3PP15_9ASCO|nr:Rgp1-domain-containing protein [Nadsonia fulvescens var. elongata DSM 6958]